MLGLVLPFDTQVEEFWKICIGDSDTTMIAEFTDLDPEFNYVTGHLEIDCRAKETNVQKRLYTCIMTLMRISKMTDSRWIKQGSNCGDMLGLHFLGLGFLINEIKDTGLVHCFYLNAYERSTKATRTIHAKVAFISCLLLNATYIQGRYGFYKFRISRCQNAERNCKKLLSRCLNSCACDTLLEDLHGSMSHGEQVCRSNYACQYEGRQGHKKPHGSARGSFIFEQALVQSVFYVVKNGRVRRKMGVLDASC